VGEALVSFLDEKGRPSVTERVYVLPPASQIGPIIARATQGAADLNPSWRVCMKSPSTATRPLKSSKARAQKQNPTEPRKKPTRARGTAAAPGKAAVLLDSLGSSLGSIWLWGGGNGRRTSAGEQLVKSAASAIGREVGRQVIRGVLGGIFGGRR
jgi:hypothetical protein